MNTHALRILEYNKILKKLEEYAGSFAGKAKCANLEPSVDLSTIVSMQEQTSAALSRIYKHGGVSFMGLPDVGASLKRLEIGASLGAGELLAIARVLQTTLDVKQYGSNKESDGNEDVDCLDSLFYELTPLTTLQREIKRCILSETEISDDASAPLKTIRRMIKQTNDKIHNQLSHIVNAQDNQSMLQDNIVTMRNGRYCIPVKQEYKGHFSGMLHDQSSSGSTVFIEPIAIVNLNNELKELASKEQLEIEKILASLSEQAAFEAETIKTNLFTLGELDFIFARAAFAKSYQGTQPIFNQDGIIQIKQGRHPLLDAKTVVPIDIQLGGDFSMLIITGPNTGGKTVSLKTLGLFTLMGQAGLHIPAFEGSSLTVFQDVFADIGDEQSIEQSLSTFSSHMTNIISIVEHATPDTLVLFDELGGGTDPTEGAALAISILSYLNGQGIRCMATTHYSELKTFALTTPGIENACCEFDLASLRPTYRLLIGVPGKSNAFAISKKLGLPDFIIESAKSQIDSNTVDFETLIADLEKSKQTILQEQDEIKAYKEEILILKNQLKTKQESIDQKRSTLLREAKEEAREIVEEAKAFADASIRKYNQWEKNPAGANNKAMEAERAKLGKRIKDLNQDLSAKKSSRKSNHKPGDFKIGDSVHIYSMNLDGIVTSLPNSKGQMQVQMGILNTTVHISDTQLISDSKEPDYKTPYKKGNMNMLKSASIKPEINLLGKTVDEAIALLDKYLDDACLSHLNQVTIIHGKGTGALRKGIHNYLKQQSFIKSFRSGEYGEGEMGVTIVEL